MTKYFTTANISNWCTRLLWRDPYSVSSYTRKVNWPLCQRQSLVILY